jgi:hypothetical protein
MVSNQMKGDEKQQSVAFEVPFTGADRPVNFESWAVAVRRQMLAALKKRESNRLNWD